MLEALLSTFKNELAEIRGSYYKLLLLTLFPLFGFSILIAIFYKGVAFDMPIAVVDNDKSEFSRKLLTNIEASSTVKIVQMLPNTKEAIALVKASKVYGVVIIPAHFQKDVLLSKQPKVTAMINTQYILIGKILTASLLESVTNSAGEIEYVKDLIQTQNSSSAIDTISPISLQMTPFFNTYKNYFLFLVSALLPSMWQMFIVISTMVSFGTLFKAKEEERFFEGGFMKTKIIGKLLPYTLFYTSLGALILLYIYGVVGWEFQGSFLITIFAMFLTVVAYQVVALVLFTTGFDYARSLSLGAVYTAPAFAFIGVTFPVYNMNSFALFWRDMLPISHYMEFQISQANYGANVFFELDKLAVILAFWFLLIPVFMRFRLRLQA